MGKPIEVPGPLDVVIIADESGSLNMYGRGEQNARLGENTKTGPQNIRTSASYMPCLNGAHAYLVGDLQKELYQIALARMVAAAGKVDAELETAVAAALAAADQEAQKAAFDAIFVAENTAVEEADAALLAAQAALAAAEEAHAPYVDVKLAADAVEEAEAVVTALTEKAAEKEKAQTAVDDAQTTVANAEAAVSVAQADVEAATDETTRAAAEADLESAEAVFKSAEEALAVVLAAEEALSTAETDLTAAEEALAAAIAAYEADGEQNEDGDTSDETPDDVEPTADESAEADQDIATADEIIKAAQETAAAVATAETAAREAAAAVEAAKAALEAKKATVDALVKVKEMESKLAEEAVAADIYINPHDAGLEYTVFGQWGSAGNEPAVREMIKAGKLVDGTSANVEIPEILTDDDVYLALLSDWDEVALKSNGYLTFTTNYPVTKKDAETGEIVETGEVKAEKGKRMGWNPDTAHCHFEDGAYVLIEQPVNEYTVAEESTPYYNSNKLYEYWSPSADNAYGCYDRMIIEKNGIVSLAKQILEADPNNNRVAYVGFTQGAYPSLSSFNLGDNGFCGMNDLNDLLAVMGNTNGHNWTNYAHTLYMARKIISLREDQSRPCYVVFISDGVPSSSGSFSGSEYLIENGGWSVLDKENGDFPWYEDVYPVTDAKYPTSKYPQGCHPAAAEKLSEYFKAFLEEIAGEDTKFYTVGFSTNDTASALLASMASDENSFFNCKDVDEFLTDMQVVQQDIMTHYPSGVLTDVIGKDFELLIDQYHPFTVDGDKYYAQSNAAKDERVTFGTENATPDAEDASSENETPAATKISWNLEQVDEKGVQISFYVKLTDEKLNKFKNGSSRIYDTNADTKDAATGETVATGANLEYHELIVDNTKSEGYYAEEDATNLPLKTPQVKIVNGENTSENDPPQNDPPEEIPDEDVPLGEIPNVEEPLEEIPDEDIPPAEVPQTGDASALWLILSALSGTGLAGVSVLNHKKRDED